MPLENSGAFLVRAGKNVPGNMTALIDAMILYQGAAGPRVNELYIVYKEAEHWVTKHTSQVWATTRNQREEAAVAWLMGQVIQELNTAEPGLGTAFQKYELKTGNKTASAGVTKLDKGYRFERKTYVEDKTSMPASASQVRKIFEGNGKGGHNFPQITRKQWDEVAIGQWAQQKTAVVQMYFLNKIQRLRLLATCVPRPGGLTAWEDIQGQTLHTRFHKDFEMGSLNARQMYAMDRFGNLFVDFDDFGHGTLVLNLPTKGAAKAAVASRGKSNHSSLCAGREVICAGMIFFWKGQLIHIDNSSGHYAPRRQALFSAVDILRTAGTNINYLRVGVAKPEGGHDYFKAQTFLNQGWHPDWPSQSDDNKQDHWYAQMPGFIP